MVTLITTKSSVKIADGSQDAAIVSVQMAPNTQPIELVFSELGKASAFAERCHKEDGYAASIAAYMQNKG